MPVISVENLSKRYRIGKAIQHTDGSKPLLQRMAAPFHYLASTLREPDSDEIIWALKDVSFEVQRGEVVGIIGRNGAGKSTLLKILSRITEPTSGRAIINGRVGSLLEVGTGFHPELTGRENIYLNGAILGMKRAEIDRRFDEIVAFAEIERFLDTPVKRYSSGMYVRLAFAVAAHLEPEILLVDEVLAVGDYAFQKKCLGKMGDVAKEGRTVLFVSHNMASIQQLCKRGMLLSEGVVARDGVLEKVVSEYLAQGVNSQLERTWAVFEGPGNDVVRLLGIRCRNQYGEVCSQFDVRDPVTVEIEYAVLKEGSQLCLVLDFLNALGQVLVVAFDDYIYGAWAEQTPYSRGHFVSKCFVPGDFFTEGYVSIHLTIFSPPERPTQKPHVRELEILRFAVNDGMDPRGVRGNFPYEWGRPAVRPRMRWTTEHTALGHSKAKIDEELVAFERVK